ncbi:cytochrome P450 86B1-like [Cryptomeria japonica]|uniref:cytochrome P450 86B1-like n=1 Tax=Cryptomeria japonica TaxID=3369 RepID=UPI0027DA3D2B|nr:cytochrome P450 86B1-like [Cryptomeria japonica]
MASLAEVVGNGITVFPLWCVGIASIILFYIYSLKSRVRSSFRGAPVWPVVGVLPSLLLNFGQLYDWFTYLVVINGGTFRLPGPWKFRVFTADPANIEYLLKTRYHNFGKGEIFKETFRDMFGESIVVQDGEAFKRFNISVRKALASPAFRDDAAASLPAVMQQNLVPIFSHACEKGAIIDLQDVFHRLALHDVCLFGAGVELGWLKPDLPNRLLKARETIYDFVLQQVHPRWRAKQDETQGSDIGSAFIRFERESGRLYSDKGVHELFVSLILAGKDTVTPGLTWFFWLVANNPRVEAQILAELREIMKQRNSLDDLDLFSFSFEEVKRMDYLHATLTDSLRLYPPIPFELTASLEDDVLPDGTTMKKGEQILYSI